MMSAHRSIMAAFAGILLLTGLACKHTTAAPDRAVIAGYAALTGEGVLGPMDIIMVRVYDEPEFSGEFRVDADGTITFPFLGAVDVAGLTPNEASRKIVDGLADGYLVHPVVSVFVKEANSRQVLVLGNVEKPGPYPFKDGMSIVEAIAMAGGIDDEGAPNQTRVIRRVDEQELSMTVKLSAITSGSAPNVTLQPNDIVFVPRSAI